METIIENGQVSKLLKKKGEESELKAIGFSFIGSYDPDSNSTRTYAVLVVQDGEERIRVIIGNKELFTIRDLKDMLGMKVVVKYVEEVKTDNGNKYHRVQYQYNK